MNKAPLISIIIPVYYAENFMHGLIQCIQRQTLPNFEAIFIDNASPDKSSDIINEYKCKDQRIKLLRLSENIRPKGARNAGLEIARGKYITFVDADDKIYPDFLEEMYTVIAKHNADVVMCNAEHENPEYNDPSPALRHIDIFHKNKLLTEYVFSRKEIYTEASLWWDKGNFFIRPECWGKLINKKLIDYYNIRFRTNFSEDVAFIQTVFLLSRKTVALNKQLYIYNRKNENNDLTRSRASYLSGMGQVMEEVNRIISTYVQNCELKAMYISNFYFFFLPGHFEAFTDGSPYSMHLYKETLSKYTKTKGVDPSITSMDIVPHLNCIFQTSVEHDRTIYLEYIANIAEKLKEYLINRNNFSVPDTIRSYAHRNGEKNK